MPRSGKTEVKKILEEVYGFYTLDTKQVLREMAAKLTGLSPDDFITQEQKQTLFEGVERRKIMGEIGNVAEKLWGDSYMIERELKNPAFYEGKRIVVDALRKEQPRDFPGYVFQVISNRAIDTGNSFDDFYKGRNDGIIINDGSLDDLRDTVERAIRKYL